MNPSKTLLVVSMLWMTACASSGATTEQAPRLVERADLPPAVPVSFLLEDTPYAEVLALADGLQPSDAAPIYQEMSDVLVAQGESELAGAVLAHASSRGALVSTKRSALKLAATCAMGLGRCGVDLPELPTVELPGYVGGSRTARLDALLEGASNGRQVRNEVFLVAAIDEVRALPSPRARSVRWPSLLEAAHRAGSSRSTGERIWLLALHDARALGGKGFARMAWSNLCAWGSYAPDRSNPCAEAFELGIDEQLLAGRTLDVVMELASRSHWDAAVELSKALNDDELEQILALAARRGLVDTALHLARLPGAQPEEAMVLRALAMLARSGHSEAVRSHADSTDGEDADFGLSKFVLFEVDMARLELDEALNHQHYPKRWEELEARLARFPSEDRKLAVSLRYVRALAARDPDAASELLETILTRLPTRTVEGTARGALYDVRDVAELTVQLTQTPEDFPLAEVFYASLRDPQNIAESCRAYHDALTLRDVRMPSPDRSREMLDRCADARAKGAKPRPRRIEGPLGERPGQATMDYYDRLAAELVSRGQVELVATHLTVAASAAESMRVPDALLSELTRRGRHAQLLELARVLQRAGASGWSYVYVKALEITPDHALADALGAEDPARPGPQLRLTLAQSHLRVRQFDRLLSVAPTSWEAPAWAALSRTIARSGHVDSARALARRATDPNERAHLLLELAR